MKNSNRLFSLTKEKNHKILNILGIKVKWSTIPYKERKKPVLPYLEIHLVDHCNQKCGGCTHFCTLADPFFLSLESFKKDLSKINEKFHLQYLRLLGGEPLLHPQINEFLALSRQIFPNTQISLLTNGLLLDKMEDSFWKTLKESEITIDVTHYPNVKDFEKYTDICNKNNIEMLEVNKADGFYRFMDKSGKSNPSESFCGCKSIFGYCHVLRNGKLYTCAVSCYMDYYNKYFNEHMPVNPGVDIYKNNAKTILKLIAEPVENCKYCLNISKIEPKDWKVSKKEIDEWEYKID